MDIKDKLIVLSGSTGGLGVPLARKLLKCGAKLLLLDRNREKSAALKQKLLIEHPDAEITLLTADMADFASVKKAADTLSNMPIDVIIFNAGAYSIPRYICDTGYDNLFQINFLSPYYLTRRLLPVLAERGGRVVAVSSIAHNYSVVDKNDLDFHTRKPNSLAYGNAKRWLTFSLFSLFENETRATLSVSHPGISFTGITNHYPKLIFAFIKYPMKVIFPPPKKACLSIFKGVFEECQKNEWIGPRIFNVWGSPKKQRLKTCLEDEYNFIAQKAEEIYKEIEKTAKL